MLNAVNRKPGRVDKESLSSLAQFTLPQILLRQVERQGPDAVAIREKAYGIWQTYTWRDYFRYVKLAGMGLLALGLKRGEKVGLILGNHPEWLFAELGVQSMGGVAAPFFPSSSAGGLVQALNRVKAAFVVVQDQAQTDKLLTFREDLPHTRYVIYVDPTGMGAYMDNPWLISFRQLLDLGEELDNEYLELFNKELWDGNPDDPALTLAGRPREGHAERTLFTHTTFTQMACNWISNAPLKAGDDWISITPTAWIIGQMWGPGITLCGGLIVNFPEGSESAASDLREIGPSIMLMPPIFWEDLASKIRNNIDQLGMLKRKIYNLTMEIGQRVVDLESMNTKIPAHTKALRWLTSLLVCRPLLDRIGFLNCRAAYTGGAPAGNEVIRFFRANGLKLEQCWGGTETCGMFQVRPSQPPEGETGGGPSMVTGHGTIPGREGLS